MSERRRVHLLVPDVDRARLVVDRTGRPPVVALEFAAGRTTFSALHAELASMGLAADVVDLLIDQSDPPEGDPTPTHDVVCELAVRGELPGGWRWAPAEDARPAVAAALRPYVDARVAEWLGRAPVPRERSPWSFPGWAPRFEAWVRAAIRDAGMGDVVSLVPHRLWGISAVYRVGTAAGHCWAKAVYDGFRHEPAVTAFLGRHFPGQVPELVAVEPDERWMLLRHLDGDLVSSRFERTADAVRALVRIQADAAPLADELLAAGAADRGIGLLADHLAEALAHPVSSAALGVTAQEVAGLCEAVASAAAAVGELGLPSRTLVHGDFHGSNVMLHEDDVAIFDWSDAAVSHPLVDVGAWQAWFRDEPAEMDELWRTFAEAWGGVVEPERVLRARRPLEAVVGAYHVVSYARIAAQLEPLRRHEALDGLEGFFRQLRDHV